MPFARCCCKEGGNSSTQWKEVSRSGIRTRLYPNIQHHARNMSLRISSRAKLHLVLAIRSMSWCSRNPTRPTDRPTRPITAQRSQSPREGPCSRPRSRSHSRYTWNGNKIPFKTKFHPPRVFIYLFFAHMRVRGKVVQGFVAGEDALLSLRVPVGNADRKL